MLNDVMIMMLMLMMMLLMMMMMMLMRMMNPMMMMIMMMMMMMITMLMMAIKRKGWQTWFFLNAVLSNSLLSTADSNIIMIVNKELLKTIMKRWEDTDKNESNDQWVTIIGHTVCTRGNWGHIMKNTKRKSEGCLRINSSPVVSAH